MSGNPRHLSEGRSLTKAGGNGLRLEPNGTKELGKTSPGKISIGEPIPEAGKRKPKKGECNSTNTHLASRSERKGKQPPGSSRNGTDLTERSESCNQTPPKCTWLDGLPKRVLLKTQCPGSLAKVKRGGRRQKVSRVYVVRKVGKARKGNEKKNTRITIKCLCNPLDHPRRVRLL